MAHLQPKIGTGTSDYNMLLRGIMLPPCDESTSADTVSTQKLEARTAKARWQQSQPNAETASTEGRGGQAAA